MYGCRNLFDKFCYIFANKIMYKLFLRVNHVQTRSTDYVYGVTDDGVEGRASVARGPELSATGGSAPQGAPIYGYSTLV